MKTAKTAALLTATVLTATLLSVALLPACGSNSSGPSIYEITTTAKAAPAAAPTSAATSADNRYFADLDKAGVPYPQARKDLVIEKGQYVCNLLKDGTSWRDVITIWGPENDLSWIDQAAAAVDAYCPEFKAQLK
ncbi:DUF732 domain-containing protein [Nocardia sp. NPDC059246]|uniref:DUF732 domain-containing protein n=1 Tax=unclassified Nocardia TaxID=2637762 RepID=UPI00369404C3